MSGHVGQHAPAHAPPPAPPRVTCLLELPSTTAVDRRSTIPVGGTDKNLCRCFGAPARRVFPDHLITYSRALERPFDTFVPSFDDECLSERRRVPRAPPQGRTRTSTSSLTSPRWTQTKSAKCDGLC